MAPLQLTLGISLGPELDLPGFVPGANAGALAAVEALAHQPQFIYLWGEPGTGKTHLLHAACRAAAEDGRRVGLLPLSRADDWRPEMLEGWDGLDLVAIDDIDRVLGNPEWEQRLFLLYNALRDAGASLVIAADRPPASFTGGLPDLLSRLAGMLVFQLRPLDDDGRLQALAGRARSRGMELPEEVGRYLLTRVSRNMHDLIALLDRLDRVSLARQRRLTIPFVRELLESP